MKFRTLLTFFLLFIIVIGILDHQIQTLSAENTRLSQQLFDAREGLLSCASNRGFTLLLEKEAIFVDCIRSPVWSDYSVENRPVLKSTARWIKERDRALEHLRSRKPPRS